MLEVERVSRSFGGVAALSEVDLRVAAGEVVGLIGPNGSGKTTLLNAITGLTPAERGRVRFDGRNVTNLRPDRIALLGLARTFQTPRILHRMTVLENLATALFAGSARVRTLSAAGRDRLLGLLDECGLGDRTDELASKLTLPEQRRLELVRTLVSDPKLILLDEPAGGMTPAETEGMARLIAEVAAKGTDLHRHRAQDRHDLVALRTDLRPRLRARDRGRNDGGGARGRGRPRGLSRPAGRGRLTVAAMLEVRDLHVSYGKVRAVQGISLRVDEGEIVALIGANGAGKSSTMHAICGVTRPAKGTIAFRGRDITGRPAHRVVPLGIAQVPEGRLIFDDLTIEENLVLGGITRARASERKRMDRVLELFPVLAPRTGETASNLSGGQQQLLAIARGLMSDPTFIMLDEPSLGLAPLAAQEVFDLFATLRRNGLTILLVEQNVRQALGIADRGYVIESGRIILEGESATPARGRRDWSRAYLGIERQ